MQRPWRSFRGQLPKLGQCPAPARRIRLAAELSLLKFQCHRARVCLRVLVAALDQQRPPRRGRDVHGAIQRIAQSLQQRVGSGGGCGQVRPCGDAFNLPVGSRQPQRMQQHTAPCERLSFDACGQDAVLCKPLGHRITGWRARQSTRDECVQQRGVDRLGRQAVGKRVQVRAGHPTQRQRDYHSRLRPVAHLHGAGHARRRRRDGRHARHGT